MICPAPQYSRSQIAAEIARRQTPADLHPKQRTAFETPATEVLYGGAAGGGKSHLMRRAAITWCRWIPGLQVYLFRREFPDLHKNHMEGVGSFPSLLADDVQAKRVRIIWGKNQIRFANGSVIHLCHCQYAKNVYSYQGAEIHVLMIDELTQWTEKMYTYLRSRVRLGGLRVPAWLKALFPRILCGANPGGIGHNWVKAKFIDIAAPGAITRIDGDDGGMLRQFIRALLDDNPTQTENDPDYEAKLEGMGDPNLVRAMRDGDWDIVAGGMFDDVWSRDLHVVRPFDVPSSWDIFRAFDWGSSKPFSVGWWAESDGTADGDAPLVPRGTLFRIAEWYGWNGKPNEGLRMIDTEIARGIVRREEELGIRHRVQPGPADASIFDKINGDSIADVMRRLGVSFLPSDKKPGTRVRGVEAMRRRLQAARQRPMEDPGLFVFDHCTDGFIRTIPVLPRDERNPEDVDTNAEDHVHDETRYVCLRSRIELPTSGRFAIGV